MKPGIYLNGQPLNLDKLIDISIIEDAYEFHYIHKPQKPRNWVSRKLRRSAVRSIPVEQYIAEQMKGD